MSSASTRHRTSRRHSSAVELVWHFRWPVAPCEIAEASLQVIEEPAPTPETYLPLQHLELPSELARLRKGDEPGLVEFASRYGLLGLGAWERSTPWDLPGPGGKDRLPPRPPEPLTWCWLHVDMVRAVMEAELALAERKEGSVRSLVRALAERYPDTIGGQSVQMASVPVPRAWRPSPVPVMVVASGPAGPIRGSLERFSALVIENNLEGLVISPTHEPGSVKAALRFPALLPAIYWLVLDAAQRRALRRCRECGTPFVAGRLDQEFCPGVRGPQGKQLPSRCSSRFRTRESRRRSKRSPSP